ncbi:MAG TPA: hypothetical protein VFE03_00110, partial [Caulobacteraceae bacterium]|nr:hypothetical protein [Caulobacteraceae bacterium]
MRRVWIAAAGGCAALAAWGAVAAGRVAPVNPTSRPPAAAARPVTEDYFGTKITDPYRYMEDLKNPEVTGWMTAQGAYTRHVLDSIKPRAAFLERVSKFGAGFGVVVSYQTYGGRSFYLERAPGADNFDLMVRDADGATRKIIDTEALRKADGLPHAVNYYQASPDGRLIAAGVSAGGSEDAALSVYDAASGKVVAGPLARAQFGAVAWTADSKALTLNQLQALPAGAPRMERYNNSAAAYWDLKGEPVELAGAKTGRGPKLDAIQIPAMILADGSPVAALGATAGVQNEVSIWIAPLARMTDPAAPWRRLTTPDDGVTGGALLGGDIYLLSHKEAPTFQVLKLAADADLGAAKAVLPARADMVLTGIAAGRDGVYVSALEGVYSKLYRLPAAGGPAEEVALPFKGSIVQVFADTTRD